MATTPEEKAKDLISKFAPKCSGNSQEILNHELAKQCAIILCDEILNICPAADIGLYALKDEGDTSFVEYWEQVKEHIEQL